jgi:predicted TIM-barrel fold metal-dependent hydrolase
VAAFPDDVAVRETIDAIGLDNVVFSSDWPHKSLTEQHTTLDVFMGRDDLTEAEKQAILAVNPRKWMEL